MSPACLFPAFDERDYHNQRGRNGNRGYSWEGWGDCYSRPQGLAIFASSNDTWYVMEGWS